MTLEIAPTPKNLQALVDGDDRLRTTIRREAGCDNRDAPPVRVAYGTVAPEERGHGYWFRWLGKWKAAPGSYQHSTRRIVVGHRWLAEYLRFGRDAERAGQAVAKIEARARGHQRRFLAGWKKKQERKQAAAPPSLAAACRKALGDGRIAVDPVTREAIAVARQPYRQGLVWRAEGGRQIRSARLRAIRAVDEAAKGGAYNASCEQAEATLDRMRARLRPADVRLCEELLLAQEERRRERLAGLLDSFREGHPVSNDPEALVATVSEQEALEEAFAERQRALALRAVAS